MSGSSRAGVRTGTVSAAVAGAERNGGPTAGLQAMVGDRKVVRAGISYYGEGVRSWPDRVHRHPEPELFLCLQGSGRFETPDGALEVRPGDFLVVDGDVEHHQVGGTGGLCMSWWILELEQP